MQKNEEEEKSKPEKKNYSRTEKNTGKRRYALWEKAEEKTWPEQKRGSRDQHLMPKIQWCQNHKLLSLNASKIVREKVSSSTIYKKKMRETKKARRKKRAAAEQKRTGKRRYAFGGKAGGGMA